MMGIQFDFLLILTSVSASFKIFDKFLRPEDREIYFRFVFATFLSHYGLAGSITAQFL